MFEITVSDTHISDSLFGLLLSIPCFLNSIFNLTLNLDKVRLQLLLLVNEDGVLNVKNSHVSDLLCPLKYLSLCLFKRHVLVWITE